MRNVFDQYSQPENQLTHALASALNADPRLVRPFLRQVARLRGEIPRSLQVTEQALPGEAPLSDGSAKGLPDACIYSEQDAWALVIESKVSSSLTRDQLDRHLSTMERRGFTTLHLLALTVDDPRARLPERASCRRWSEVYSWLSRQHKSEWAMRVSEFMEHAEARWSGGEYLKEGTLTEFAGYQFGPDQPVTYLEAKRVLRLAMERLRSHKDLERRLHADLSAAGRSAITGKESRAVWDYIPLKTAGRGEVFTKSPHLTHGINERGVDAMLTFPNQVRTELRRNLIDLGEEGFFEIVADVERNLRQVLCSVRDARPMFRAVQRHYRSQRAVPTVDALIEFDLRTALPSSRGSKASRVRAQKQWLRAAFDCLAHKQSNYQIQIGANFPHQGPRSKLASKDATNLIAETWIACKPILWAALGK